MVHVLLVILKIIGILLLAILGLALLLVFAVLLVPVRYRVNASYREELRGYARVSWLLRLLTYRAEYGERGLVQKIRVCGICIWRSDKDRDEVDEAVESVLTEEEQALYEELKRDETWREHPDFGEGERGGNSGDAAEKRAEETEKRGRSEDGKPGEGMEAAPEQVTAKNPESAGAEAREQAARAEGSDDARAGVSDAAKAKSSDAARAESSAPSNATPPAPGEAEPSASRPGLFSRILGRIRGVIEKLRFSFRAICDKLKSGRRLFDTASGWVQDEKNQASVKLLLRQLTAALRHVMPRKGHASVTFGFDDPYTTGQVLAAVSPFYPIFHRVIELQPVFDRQVFSGEGDFRGRIRLFNLLWLCFGIYRDKHTWNLICSFRK